MTDKRVLLTTSYGPNHLGWGEDMFDLMKSRLAKGHGPFSLASHCHYFGLYLIAENISNPTTVLENPRWDDFVAELKKGYDYVGIQLKSLHTPKIARMVRHVRENYPDTEVVIGGYGVSTLNTPVPGDKNGDGAYIRENSHHLCRREGVGFMRELLDDKPYDREITQYQMPMAGFSVSGLDRFQARTPIILASLGCPNACDFCNTSAFFHNKKIYVAEPEQVYRYMKHYQKRQGFEDVFVLLFDEDFFLNTAYVRELGRLIRSDKKTWGFRYFTFGSMKSMSQFTFEELRENGLGAVWIGVESFLSDAGTTEDTYAKRRCEDVRKMFRGLQSQGIGTIASLVLGFDFHTPENLKDDIDKFVALKPALYQISPLTPCPGTPLYDRMMEENRLLDTYKWEDFHLWKDDVFKLKHFKEGEIKEFYDYAHRQIRDMNGPPPLMAMENAIDAYAAWKDSPDEFRQYHAQRAKMMAMGVYQYLHAIKREHTSPVVREKALELEKRFKREISEPPIFTYPVSRFIRSRIRRKARRPRQEVVSNPAPRWTYYHSRGPNDASVYVKKGKRNKEARPYRDRRTPISIRRLRRGGD